MKSNKDGVQRVLRASLRCVILRVFVEPVARGLGQCGGVRHNISSEFDEKQRRWCLSVCLQLRARRGARAARCELFDFGAWFGSADGDVGASVITSAACHRSTLARRASEGAPRTIEAAASGGYPSLARRASVGASNAFSCRSYDRGPMWVLTRAAAHYARYRCGPPCFWWAAARFSRASCRFGIHRVAAQYGRFWVESLWPARPRS